MVSLPIVLVTRPRAAGWVRSIALRLYRAGILIAIIWLIHAHAERLRREASGEITPAETRAFFPAAAVLEADRSERMGFHVKDAAGKRLGYVLRTSPVSDRITGYAGPTDTLIAMDNDMRVIGIRVRSSADTTLHVRDVQLDKYFMKTWTGKGWDEIAGKDPRELRIEGVSGASMTSMAIANGIHQRFRQALQPVPRQPSLRLRTGDIGLMGVMAVALLFSFTNLRRRTWIRRVFQIVLIGYVGFYNGDLLAQSLLSGWAANGVPWRLAPGLVLLGAVALLVPWTSRRAVYCSQLCPHGAAQELLGRVTRRRLIIPKAVENGLRWVPALLIAVVLIVTFHRLPFELASIEPFDAYVIRVAGVATIAIAVVGLIAAMFIPMAYCKYGCPTGLVLSFVRSHGCADGFSRRDFGAALLLLLAVALFASYPQVHHWIVR
jgi:NosR/NirI family nitrous oxide reductase transcriptional regulator